MNKNTKIAHTPGPWKNLASSFTITSEEGHICNYFVNHETADGEIEANARLIAAAPDLLNDLYEIGMIAALAPHNDEKEARAAFERISRLCRHRIAETEGQS